MRFFCYYNYATFLWRQEEENCWQNRRQSPRKLGENYELWTGGCASAAERWILCCCSSWCCWGKRVSAFTYASCCAFEHTNAHWSHSMRFHETACCPFTISALKNEHPSSIPLPIFLFFNNDFLFFLLTLKDANYGAIFLSTCSEKNHKDCERLFARIDLARENPLSLKIVMKIQLHIICIF